MTTNDHAKLTYKDGELIYEAGTNPDNERLKLIKQLVDEMDNGELTNFISDGAHTFGDLYYQRMVLTSVIAKSLVTSDKPHGKVFRSKLHADGTMFKDYFIVVFKTVEGNFSYHYHMDNWNNFYFVKEIPKAPEYDGHTDVDVSRLLTMFPSMINNS